MIGNIMPIMVRRIFAGGQAPNQWQRSLGQQTAWVTGWQQVSYWIDEAILTRRPFLLRTPLWGQSLAELTGRTTRLDAVEPEPEQLPGQSSRRTGRVRPGFPGDRQMAKSDRPAFFSALSPERDRHRPGGYRTHLNPVTREPAEFTGFTGSVLPIKKHNRPQARLGQRDGRDKQISYPGQLKEKVERRLLHRLAGSPVATGDYRLTQNQQPLQFSVPQTVSSWPIDALAAQSGYTASLSRRAGQRLHRPGTNRSVSGGDGISHEHFVTGSGPGSAEWPTADARNYERESAASLANFAAQWNFPLAGPTAPESLLIRLVQQDSHSGPHNSVVQRNNGGPRSVEPPAGANNLARNSQSPPPAGMSARPAGQTPPVTGQQVVGVKSAIQSGAHAPVLPPQTAPRLPDLGPPRQVREATTPLGTGLIQQQARETREPAGDDLQELAHKVQRILDEEARRFGIDV